MNPYPYNSPIILTDTIYTAFGGLTGSSTAFQRSASYLIAEEEVSDDINTLLLPTVVTGTFQFPVLSSRLLLDYGYVNEIYTTKFVNFEGDTLLTVDGVNNVYVSLHDPTLGIMVINPSLAGCTVPYQIQVAYNVGLPSGTSYHPNVLLALTTYAQILVNEMIGFGNESSGDIGVQEFRNQQYYEARTKLLRTSFGTSAEAQFVHKLLAKLRKYRRVGL